MREYTISELKAIAESAFNYLKKHFDKSILHHNFVMVRGDLPNNKLASFNVYGNQKVYVDVITFDEKKLIRKLRNGKIEDDFDDKLPMVIDEIVAGEVGAILFYVGHKLNTSGLEDVQELIGYYSGIVYSNRRRNQNYSLFLRSIRNEELYDKAKRMYLKFKDTKITELVNFKDLDGYNNLISKMEM